MGGCTQNGARLLAHHHSRKGGMDCARRAAQFKRSMKTRFSYGHIFRPHKFSSDEVEDHFQLLFTDAAYFDSFCQRAVLPSESTSAEQRVAIACQRANDAYVAYELGMSLFDACTDPRRESFEEMRRRFLDERFGCRAPTTNAEIFELIGNYRRQRINTQDHDNGS
jgi:hypothetical protein